MSIMISTGNIGSGKTATVVYDMFKQWYDRTIYTNIQTFGLPNVKLLNEGMIIKKTLVKELKKKDGTIEPLYKLEVNKEFWTDRPPEPITIVLDEAHTLFSSRQSQTKKNKLISDWLSMVRKLLSSSADDEGGQLIFITQTSRKIDINARELAKFRLNICHYKKSCTKCNLAWNESSDMYEPLFLCPRCRSSKLKKSNHVIEVYKFASEEDLIRFKDYAMRTYYDHYYIQDIASIFSKYNTLQFQDLFSED